MNILAIGNSFSTDAMRYLHEIAMADGEKITTVNLYIGGCPLDLHEENIKNDARAYSIEYNGETTGFSVSSRGADPTAKYIRSIKGSHSANNARMGFIFT